MLPPANREQRGMDRPGKGLSACVISFNRAAILGTCLRAVRFADEVLVIDKTSTDGARRVATRFADRVVTVPWSPTVEETRAQAVTLCRHDWILLLDDDECLNGAAARFIAEELESPRADAYALPLRHYILGMHDERAYYWPEHHVRLFRRDAVRFGGTVHAGTTVLTEKVMRVPETAGPCIHHLSHPDVASWIERTNRYTSRPDRARVEHDGLDLSTFATARIAHWLARTGVADATVPGAFPAGFPDAGQGTPSAMSPDTPDEVSPGTLPGNRPEPSPVGGACPDSDYLVAVALLRAVYDIVDRLKTWEAERPFTGAERFAALCAALDAEHAAPTPPSPVRSWAKRLGSALLAAPRIGWATAAGGPISLPAFRHRPE